MTVLPATSLRQLFLATLLAIGVATLADAASYSITSLDDSGPGTLREALSQANAAPGPHVIDFAVPGVVELQSALPDLLVSLTLNGHVEGTTLRRVGPDQHPVLHLPDMSSREVVLRDLTLTGGDHQEAGGLWAVDGSLRLERCLLHGNRGFVAGALHVEGVSLTLVDCELSGNDSELNGGAIVNEGSAEITGCRVVDNTAQVNGRFGSTYGGIHFLRTSFELRDSLVAGNAGGTVGGLVAVFSNGELVNVTLSGNAALDSGGFRVGGLREYASQLVMAHCTVAENTSTWHGGLYLEQGSHGLINTIVADNEPTNMAVVSGAGFSFNESNLVESCSGSCPSWAWSADPGLHALSVCGDTWVHELSADSIARGAALTVVDGNPFDTPSTDQCGRVRDASPDLGAAERQTCDSHDFDGLPAGTVLDGQYFNLTITGTTPPMIFDTGAVTCADADLATPGEGPGNDVARDGVVILSEEWSDCAPDDARDGGLLSFDFPTPREVAWVGLLDIDEEGSVVRAYDATGGLLASVDVPAQADNGWQAVMLDVEDCVTVEVELHGSGAVTDLTCAPALRRGRIDDLRGQRGSGSVLRDRRGSRR
ncbi:MAG: hypothetical protein AAF533_26680 [Acidobacteriota bacterium]